MTPDDLAKYIPPEVVEAAARKLITQRVDADVWNHISETMKNFYRQDARAALAAGLAAWPRITKTEYAKPSALILPLSQEGGE